MRGTGAHLVSPWIILSTLCIPLNTYPSCICSFFGDTPLAKAGGFGLRLKAGSIGHPADSRRYTTLK